MNLMQRLVISNLFGFGFVALSWVAAIPLYETLESRGSWSLPWLLGSLLLILLDVGYRYRGIRWKQRRQADQADGASSDLKNRWLTPTRGASLFVLPAWVVGTVSAMVFAVLSVLDLLWRNSHLPMIG
jgi:hypothetical protein